MLRTRPRLAESAAGTQGRCPLLGLFEQRTDPVSPLSTVDARGNQTWDGNPANENAPKKVFCETLLRIHPAVSRSHKTVHFGTKRVCRKKSNVDPQVFANDRVKALYRFFSRSRGGDSPLSRCPNSAFPPGPV